MLTKPYLAFMGTYTIVAQTTRTYYSDINYHAINKTLLLHDYQVVPFEIFALQSKLFPKYSYFVFTDWNVHIIWTTKALKNDRCYPQTSVLLDL